MQRVNSTNVKGWTFGVQFLCGIRSISKHPRLSASVRRNAVFSEADGMGAQGRRVARRHRTTLATRRNSRLRSTMCVRDYKP